MSRLSVLLVDDHPDFLAAAAEFLSRDLPLPEPSEAEGDRPQIQVIILPQGSRVKHLAKILRGGVAGYLLKSSATVELEKVLQASGRGQIHLGPAVSRAVIDAYSGRITKGTPDRPDPLTARQREVLSLLADGHSTKEIAFKLKVSAKTVESHRSHLMKRLGIYDVAGLVKYAMHLGLVPSHQEIP